MSQHVDGTPDDPILDVIVDPEAGSMSFDQWLASLADDEPTYVDAGAAEILREIRDHGER